MDEKEKKLREDIDQLLEEERVIREKRQILQAELWTVTMERFLGVVSGSTPDSPEYDGE